MYQIEYFKPETNQLHYISGVDSDIEVITYFSEMMNSIEHIVVYLN